MQILLKSENSTINRLKLFSQSDKQSKLFDMNNVIKFFSGQNRFVIEGFFDIVPAEDIALVLNCKKLKRSKACDDIASLLVLDCEASPDEDKGQISAIPTDDQDDMDEDAELFQLDSVIVIQ